MHSILAHILTASLAGNFLVVQSCMSFTGKLVNTKQKLQKFEHVVEADLCRLLLVPLHNGQKWHEKGKLVIGLMLLNSLDKKSKAQQDMTHS